METSKAVKEYTVGPDNMNESIPPLPHIEVSDFTQRHYIDQQSLDRAMCIIYERRPHFFLKSVERDRKYERDETTDAKERFHDGFFDELRARSALIESEGIPLGPQMRESVGIDSTWGAGLWRRPILRICARG